MQLNYTITGSITVPDDTKPVVGVTNQFQLPTGEVITVQPVIESWSEDGDDHQNLSYRQAEAIGVTVEDYDRTLEELPKWLEDAYAAGPPDPPVVLETKALSAADAYASTEVSASSFYAK